MIRLPDEVTELSAEIVWGEDRRIIFLTGAEKKFLYNGTNLTRTIRLVNEELETEFCSIAKPIRKLDLPVIVAINGDAVGIGLELALACDIGIATKRCHFGLPHIMSGLILWDLGNQRLSRLIGRGESV